MESKKERFFASFQQLSAMVCPTCGGTLHREGDTLICKSGHSLNVNRKGFINVLSRQTEGCYDQKLFEARQHVFQSGCYREVIRAIISLLPQKTRTVLDAGCGEGWWLNQLLSEDDSRTGAGVDISRDAIAKASDWPCRALWAVADIRRLPFSDHRFDAVLDILTPACYEEFQRLLAPDGVLIKVYPGENYLREIRAARGLPLYEGGQVDRYLHEKAHVLDSRRVETVCPVSPLLWADFVHMTPLNQDLSDEEKTLLAAHPAETVTVDLHVTKVVFP